MHFEMSSAICLSLDQSKILSSGNELMKKNHKIDTVRRFETHMRNALTKGSFMHLQDIMPGKTSPNYGPILCQVRPHLIMDAHYARQGII